MSRFVLLARAAREEPSATAVEPRNLQRAAANEAAAGAVPIAQRAPRFEIASPTSSLPQRTALWFWAESSEPAP